MAIEEELAAKAGGSSLPLLAGLGLVIALIVLALRYIQTSDKVKAVTETNTKSGGSTAGAKKLDNKVTLNPQADAAYLVNCLRPDSTPLGILYAIATTPDTVAVTSKHLAMAADLRDKKRDHLKGKEKEASHKSMDDLFDDDDDGWAEDDQDDPAAQAAKKAKEEKEKEAKRLAKATGKDVTDFNKVKLEGVDEGVLGQQWVMDNLTKMGVWPPPSLNETFVKDSKFDLDGKSVGAMDHPGVQRNLIMTMGRLNAKQLNTHPELTAAGPKGLIDPTYFQATMEYRQRVGQMLEATLRMACTLRSYRLAVSILDAIVMFKIGLMSVDGEEQLTWFKDLMAKQYGPSGVPKLVIEEKFLGVPTPEPSKEAGVDKTEAEKKEATKNKIVQQIMQTKQVTTTDKQMALEMQITRQHAESFTKEKLAMCQRQGIPPQIALQSYREAWFILVRAKKVSEDGTPIPEWDGALGDAKTSAKSHMELLKDKNDPLYKMLEPASIKSFEKEFESTAHNMENKIVIGWPFVISNVAQKTGKVKIHLPPPLEAGKYEFNVTIKI
mmetsp:Transcript_22906/g.41104  ORF Transcript_22906/g.41104 Transcript_22906/m.41104 type:complete len:552 (+) Transcript_22906:48-1703(+)